MHELSRGQSFGIGPCIIVSLIEVRGETARLGVRAPRHLGVRKKESVQKAKGVTGQAVYQATDDPNDITVTHDFVSVAAAQDFVNSDELKKAMQGGGVIGTPTIWFTNKK